MNWKEEYPRLFELFESSDRECNDNYFSHMNDEKTRKYGKASYMKWENILSQLDSVAFKHLVSKSKRNVTVCHKYRGWEQLFNCLNEAIGYIYLKEQEYNEIDFIDESNEERPDLFAKSEKKSALLEVKTIRKSDIDVLRDRAWKSIDEIPEGLKSKIISDVNKAKSQFDSFGVEVNHKICYIIISLDLAIDMNKTNRDKINKFIDAIDNSGIEIVHELHTA